MDKNKRFFRIISVILSLIIIAEVLPLSVWAEDFTDYQSVAQAQIDNAEVAESPITGEVIEEREACKKVFEREDGSYTAILTQEPIHCYENGGWVEIDNTLSESNGTISNSRNTFSVGLPSQLSASSEITVSDGGNELSFSMNGIKTSGADIENSAQSSDSSELINLQNKSSSVTYENVMDGTDLIYNVGETTLKESIVLESCPQNGRSYSYKVNAGGVLSLNDDGSVDVVKNGEKIFVFERPYMFDSAEASSDSITVSLSGGENGEYTLTYTPDFNWLSAASYPVTIDPTIRHYQASTIITSFAGTSRAAEADLADNYFIEKDSAHSTELYIKLAPDAFSRYGADVVFTNAELSLRCQATKNDDKIGVYPLEQSWEAGNTELLNKSSQILDYNVIPYGAAETRYVWDITEPLSKWSIDQAPNNGVAVAAYNDTDCSTKITRMSTSVYTTWRPWVELNYVVVDNMGSNDVETIDMGRAGTMYLNKYTGTYYLTRTDLGLNGNVMPVELTSIYNPWGDQASAVTTCGGYWLFGYFNRINYSGTVYEDGKDKKIYRYRDSGGMITAFKEVTEQETADSIGEGYTTANLETHTRYEATCGDVSKTLWIPKTVADNKDYVNMFVEDVQYRYVLDGSGRLSAILNKETGKSVEISYSSSTSYTVTKITDGVGRQYKINYGYNSLGSVIGTGVEVLSASGQTITINTADGAVPVGVSYNVTETTGGKKQLCGVAYGDGESVSYTYNSDNLLTSVTDVDGSRLELTYSGSRVIGYKKYASYVSVNNPANCFEKGMDISFDSAGQRTFCYYEYDPSAPSQVVIQRYNSKLEATDYITSDNDYSYTQYENMNDASSDMLSYSGNSDGAKNLLPNGIFNNMRYWLGIPSGSAKLVTVTEGISSHFTDINSTVCRVQGADGRNTRLYQTVSTLPANGEDDVYTVSAWVIPQANVCGVQYQNEYSHTEKTFALCVMDSEENILARYDFDAAQGVMQFGAVSFRTETDLANVKVMFIFDNQPGSFLADGVSLVKSDNGYVYIEAEEDSEIQSTPDSKIIVDGKTYRTEPCGDCGCAQCNMPVNVTSGGEEITVYYDCACRDENAVCNCLGCRQARGRTKTADVNGSPVLSAISDGSKTMTSKACTYTADGNYLASAFGSFGDTIYNNYNHDTGLLDSFGYEENAGGVVNPVNYTYNAVGTLISVSQTAADLANGGTLNIKSDYSYSGDRLMSVSHNGTSYSFDYDPYGNMASASVNGSSIVSYTYPDHQNVGTITYANGLTISYVYDSSNNITEIRYNGSLKYEYIYTDNTLSKSYDYDNMLVTYYTESATTVKQFSLENSVPVDGEVIYSYSSEDNGETIFGETFTFSDSVQTYNAGTDTVVSSYELSYGGKSVLLKSTVDFFGRMTDKEQTYTMQTDEGTVQTVLSADYTYADTASTASNAVTGIKNTLNGSELSNYTYTYDSAGNILTVNNQGAPLYKYVYDEAGQIAVDYNFVQGSAAKYTYDANGNLTSKTPYTSVTSADLSTATAGETINYAYSDANWTDKLTSYNGQTITYDEIGNPTSYRGAVLTWNGRLLTSYEKDGERWEYFYNADGLRQSKKSYKDGEYQGECKYFWNNGKLCGSKVYLANGNAVAVNYLFDGDETIGVAIGDMNLLFVKNLQGDITSVIYANDGSKAFDCYYDAWGRISFSQDNSIAAALVKAMIMAATNLSYRGYYYDFENGLYYLQSRYYDPEVGRFINLDDTKIAVKTVGEVFGANLFAYCGNNPVNFIDIFGYKAFDFLRDKENGFLGFYNTGNSFSDFFNKPWSTIKRPWQMHTGYNNLYDKSAFLAGMYLDWIVSEFKYKEEEWRIELWKGRYGISIGAEIGIYWKPKNYGSFRQWSCYNDFMHMVLLLGYVNKRKGEYHFNDILFREDNHWWLTGFMASANLMRANPFGNSLAVAAQIDFLDAEMAQLFVDNCIGDGFFQFLVRESSVLIIWFSKDYGEVWF